MIWLKISCLFTSELKNWTKNEGLPQCAKEGFQYNWIIGLKSDSHCGNLLVEKEVQGGENDFAEKIKIFLYVRVPYKSVKCGVACNYVKIFGEQSSPAEESWMK